MSPHKGAFRRSEQVARPKHSWRPVAARRLPSSATAPRRRPAGDAPRLMGAAAGSRCLPARTNFRGGRPRARCETMRRSPPEPCRVSRLQSSRRRQALTEPSGIARARRGRPRRPTKETSPRTPAWRAGQTSSIGRSSSSQARASGSIAESAGSGTPKGHSPRSEAGIVRCDPVGMLTPPALRVEETSAGRQSALSH
jgi:hypothetical protein